MLLFVRRRGTRRDLMWFAAFYGFSLPALLTAQPRTPNLIVAGLIMLDVIVFAVTIYVTWKYRKVADASDAAAEAPQVKREYLAPIQLEALRRSDTVIHDRDRS